MKRLRVLTLCSMVVAGTIFFCKKRNPVTIPAGYGLVVNREWMKMANNPQTPAKNVRPADQTFLTYPEWYLVFSPEEQAAYYKDHTETTFPFMSHTAQIWQSYSIVNDQIKEVYPVNKGYHFMIWVIGSSATAEYSIKAWYETLIGRITDTRHVVAAEDTFNAGFTSRYVSFIKDYPWYAFNFRRELRILWDNTPFRSEHFLRSAERRYILTSELLVKTVYGKLIGIGTKNIYDEALPVTAAVLEPAHSFDSSIHIKQRYADSSVLILMPRYDRFLPAAMDLASKGYRFREIAGNKAAIVLSAFVPASYSFNYGPGKLVFTQVTASRPAEKRIVIAVPVANLSDVLLQLRQNRVAVEHVFDY